MRYSDLAKQEALREWDKARKAAAFEDVLGLFGFAQKGLLSFDEVQRSLRLTQRNYRGLQDIEIDRIRGSVGRYKDFTQTFLPRNETMRDRWTRVSVAGVEQGFPPIDVYQVGDAYFVLDGNHRVSIARQSREKTIQAHVWEFITPVGLSADADIEEVIIKAEYKDFLEKTGFDPMTMEQEIVFTTPG
ncbi:MAG: hypothetical protein IT326_10040, partial [Anaerolineae bacterium]|nr:hypothetical protein [Anaerolineae bacterium]